MVFWLVTVFVLCVLAVIAEPMYSLYCFLVLRKLKEEVEWAYSDVLATVYGNWEFESFYDKLLCVNRAMNRLNKAEEALRAKEEALGLD